MTQLSRNNTSAAAILKCSNQNQEVCTKLTFLYGFFLWKAKSHFIVGALGQNSTGKGNFDYVLDTQNESRVKLVSCHSPSCRLGPLRVVSEEGGMTNTENT